MSLSTCQTSLRRHVFFSLVMLCFLIICIFFAYYNTEVMFPTAAFHLERGNHSCPKVVCEKILKTKDPTPNCSTQLQIKPDHKDTVKIQSAPVDTEPDTVLLLWMWPFGIRFDTNCKPFNITKCHVTDDKSVYHKADGVMFHHRDIEENRQIMPKEPRPWFQKWVWFNMEAPIHSAKLPELQSVFNLTCNFRPDSNIPVPYGYLLPVTSEDESFKLPPKDKLVCWIVTYWEENYERVKYFRKLKKHIKIDGYGRGFGGRISKEAYSKIITSCKFYLAFENSVYVHYITEKLYNPMSLGTIPIVLGPPRQTYEEYVPGDSFIHVDDFPSPKELAERILYLDKNNTEYMRYFDWRTRFKVRGVHLGQEHACRICKYLRNNKEYRTVRDLSGWFWDERLLNNVTYDNELRPRLDIS